MVVRHLLGPDELPQVSTKIMRSDLTDEGYALVVAAYDRWLKAKDRGEPIEDVSRLEAALQKLRQQE